MPGLFITFEGGEGVGKSTQIQILEGWLKRNLNFCDICITREPGGTKNAELIRTLLLNGSVNKWLPATEAMLMSASRHEHVMNVIQPTLQRGGIVVCDRFSDSTHVYQGYVSGVNQKFLDGLEKLSCDELVPDLTILLDLCSREGLSRTTERENFESRFEATG